jgi:hypothetical protein
MEETDELARGVTPQGASSLRDGDGVMNVTAQIMVPLQILLVGPLGGTAAVAAKEQRFEHAARRQASRRELGREFATRQSVALQHYRALGAGEIHPSNTPAVEYVRSTAIVADCTL